MPSLEELNEDQVKKLAGFANSLLSNPEASRKARRLFKEHVDPKFTAPDLEMEDAISKVKEDSDKRVSDLQAKLDEEVIARRTRETEAMIREAGLEPAAVYKVMTDEKIGSFETAIKYLKASQLAAPATAAEIDHTMRMPDNIADIAKDPTGWARKEAHQALSEIMSKQGRR